MKLYLVHRNDSVDYDEYESAIVIAESQEDAIQMLKTSLEDKYGEGQEAMWGNEEDDYDPYILAWLKTKRY